MEAQGMFWTTCRRKLSSSVGTADRSRTTRRALRQEFFMNRNGTSLGGSCTKRYWYVNDWQWAADMLAMKKA
jgi:hypothetical protein